MSENGSRESVRTQNLNDEPTEIDADTPKSGKQDKRPRRTSSSSSVNSQGDRKKLRIGFEYEEITEDVSDTDEWSEDEFVATFKNAPDWAKGMMDFLKSSVSEIKSSTKKLKHEIEGLRSEVNSLKVNMRERLDNLEKTNQSYSDKFDCWQEEKSVLLQQISELKMEYQLKMDEAEQYSKRNCLIITGVKEQEREDTDRMVLDIFEKKLNICLDIFQVDRSQQIRDRPLFSLGGIVISRIQEIFFHHRLALASFFLHSCCADNFF